MSREKLLVVIPCLNEVDYISSLLDDLSELNNVEIVVVDGGSTDGTQEVIHQYGKRVCLLDNPKKIQSSGVNLAVRKFGDNAKYFLRLDVHAEYPKHFINDLVQEAEETKADSIVVTMETVGKSPAQQAVAVAQNSPLGNGGAVHRNGAVSGKWVDHGHHALMLVASFKSVGGYDESFVANEDAELDFRLIQSGFRIWLTAKTRMIYYPRSSLKSLYAQYYRYGIGRASNVLKHRQLLKVRQMIPILVFPSFLLVSLSYFHWLFSLPFFTWLVMCLGFGCWSALKNKKLFYLLAGAAVAAMHLAWSTGFCWSLILYYFRSFLGKKS